MDDHDPLDQELSPEILAQMRRPPLARRARLVSGLSRTAFARTYGIPEHLQAEWEDETTEPDAAATAYLTAIRKDPEAVAAAYNKADASKSAA